MVSGFLSIYQFSFLHTKFSEKKNPQWKINVLELNSIFFLFSIELNRKKHFNWLKVHGGKLKISVWWFFSSFFCSSWIKYHRPLYISIAFRILSLYSPETDDLIYESLTIQHEYSRWRCELWWIRFGCQEEFSFI